MMTTEVVRRVYRPHGAARELFARRDPELVISGPAGTGKSRAALEKIHAMALHTPASRYLLLRKTAASLTSTGLQTFRQHVLPEALELGVVEWYGGSSQEAPQYRYENGSAVLVGGLDRPSKVMSSEYDCVFIQEATEITVNDMEMVSTRLRNNRTRFQQLLMDCNPAHPTHWLKLRCDAGKARMLYAQHSDNPTLVNPDGSYTIAGAAYMAKLDALTGVRHARLRKGLWVAAEGLIYEEWNPAVHLVDRPAVPPDSWERVWTVDFGYTHPFVLQCWAIDPDGRAFLYREIFHSQRLVEDHAKTILSIVRRTDGTWREPKPSRIVCDHDAEDRATLEKHLGLPTVGAKKNVSQGLQLTQARMRLAGDDRARLFILRNALVERDQSLADAGRPTCTADEISGYVWNEKGKDEPKKEMDDGCDAMRYLVSDQDARPAYRIRHF